MCKMLLEALLEADSALVNVSTAVHQSISGPEYQKSAEHLLLRGGPGDMYH